ncbi:hypothetical protein KIW84_043910 [Lathyrus oleraceus]|uniref:PB1-like domain-containing protein n=1 Tax=Pisum sativum TaxID=3888 RepID=A0A9D4XIU0_PEA|nr:hypothetical protein KIW84_043910 [Pisum sativum]
MACMDLERLVKNEDYSNIRCMWYWNPRFSFSRGLRPLNNDNDVLIFSKDVIEYEEIVVYVEHNVEIPEIIDDSELGTTIDDDEVQCIGFKNVTEEMNNPDHVEVNGQDVEDDGNVVGADNIEDDVVGPDNVEDDDGGEMSVVEDYVASEFSDEDNDFTFSAESEKDFD